MDLLTKLARAFDTKGYPDDKNPDHWKTINHAPAHIDKNGNIDGGAGGKFNNKAWTSTKHPHKPESYPKDPLGSLAEATKPAEPEEKPVTSEDLEEAWKKVVKYKVAMNQSKSQKTYEKHSQNLMNAIGNYNDLAAKASPDVAKKKHNVSNMEAHAQKPWNELPKNQPQQDPLSSLAEATSSKPKDILEAMTYLTAAGSGGNEQKAQQALNDYAEQYNALPESSKEAHPDPEFVAENFNHMYDMNLMVPDPEPKQPPAPPTNPNAPMVVIRRTRRKHILSI